MVEPMHLNARGDVGATGAGISTPAFTALARNVAIR
jgi:hypothetical protein